MTHLEEWCSTGAIRYGDQDLVYDAPVAPAARTLARQVADNLRARRALMLMLGDTSMGMINGYFGPRILPLHGFAEHKIDQAWILDRGPHVDAKRMDDAFAFVRDKGV